MKALCSLNVHEARQESRPESCDMPITYVDVDTVEYQPPRQSDLRGTTVWFQLHRSDDAGIPISYALRNGCDELIGARTPAPWDERVSAKLSLRLQVRILLKVILSDTHR